MNNHNYYVYIVSSITKVLYIGVTNNLERRIYEHKKELFKGFTKKYKCKKLIYIEHFYNINDAISREKQLKKWRRSKKCALINKDNPKWNDLSRDWF